MRKIKKELTYSQRVRRGKKKRHERDADRRHSISEGYWFYFLKNKSADHANNLGRRYFFAGKPIESCPYGSGYYRDQFELGYKTERDGLPF